MQAEYKKFKDIKYKEKSSNYFTADCIGLIILFLKEINPMKLNENKLNKIEEKFKEISNKEKISKDIILENIKDIAQPIKETTKPKIGDILILENKFMPIHFGIFIQEDIILETNNIIKKSFTSKFEDLIKTKNNNYTIIRIEN